MDYQKAIREASDRQGITELCDELKKRGIESTARQTGGYIMVCSVLLSSDDGKELVMEVGEERNTICIQDLAEPTGDVAVVAFVDANEVVDNMVAVYERYQEVPFSFEDQSVYSLTVNKKVSFQSI